jgi:hypothetical protein
MLSTPKSRTISHLRVNGQYIGGVVRIRKVPTYTVETYPLLWRHVEHLAMHIEIITFFGTAQYTVFQAGK